uniref:Uncharacterized protein n=1 Tax=Echeneis naucrates TaxID=173247 RepID=A0A665X0T8_ECHNA
METNIETGNYIQSNKNVYLEPLITIALQKTATDQLLASPTGLTATLERRAVKTVLQHSGKKRKICRNQHEVLQYFLINRI